MEQQLEMWIQVQVLLWEIMVKFLIWIGLDAKHAQSETQTRQDSLANSIADTHKTGINHGITSDYLRNHGAGV